jgi:hypothetical protein
MTPHTHTTHSFFTKNGFDLEWGSPYEITLSSSGKKRIVQNYPFKEHGNRCLIDFCKTHIEKLESLSYTFSDPSNPRNLGFYRISYYSDPVDTQVSSGPQRVSSGPRQEILKIQRDILEVSKHVARPNQHELVVLSQRLGNVAMEV